MIDMLGFGLGGIAFATGIWIYLKRIRKRMKRFVLRYEMIRDRFEDG